MLNAHTYENTQAALQYVITSEIPTQYKTLLISLLTQALRDLEQDRIRSLTVDTSTEPWKVDEIQQVEVFLTDKIANSWQHADELLTHLAMRLKRSPKDVRSKATELGYAAGVDYGVARTRDRPERMPTTRGGVR